MPTVGGVMGALYSLLYRVIGSTMDISTRTQSREKDDCDFEYPDVFDCMIFGSNEICY